MSMIWRRKKKKGKLVRAYTPPTFSPSSTLVRHFRGSTAAPVRGNLKAPWGGNIQRIEIILFSKWWNFNDVRLLLLFFTERKMGESGSRSIFQTHLISGYWTADCVSNVRPSKEVPIEKTKKNKKKTEKSSHHNRKSTTVIFLSITGAMTVTFSIWAVDCWLVECDFCCFLSSKQ